MTAPWMTCFAGKRPARVATAPPTSIGPSATASRSISSPPAPDPDVNRRRVALTHQIDWDRVRERTADAPFAAAFFTLVEELGVVPTSSGT